MVECEDAPGDASDNSQQMEPQNEVNIIVNVCEEEEEEAPFVTIAESPTVASLKAFVSEVPSTLKNQNQEVTSQETGADIYGPSHDIDGGWAWVVLVAAFFAFATASGLFYTFSMYYVVFLDVFKDTRSATAWVGSLNTAFFMLGGPVASAFIQKHGCRVTVMLAGVISTGGLVASSFAGNLQTLYLTYGVISALGCCLNYSAWVVALGSYFHRLHYVATAIAMSGVGVGIFFFVPFLTYSIGEFGWRGSFFINAGLTLQFCVYGALIFPLKPTKVRQDNLETEQSFAPDEPLVSPRKDIGRSVSTLNLCGTSSYISHSMNSLAERSACRWGNSVGTIVEIQGTDGTASVHLDEVGKIPALPEDGKPLEFLRRLVRHNIRDLEIFCGCVRKRPSLQKVFTNEMVNKYLWSSDSKMAAVEKKPLPVIEEEVHDGPQTVCDLARDIRFWPLMYSSCTWMMSCLTIYILLKDFAVSKGMGETSSYVLSGMGVGDMLGRLSCGFISSNPRVSPLLFYSTCQVGCSLLILALYGANTPILFVSAGVLFSFISGFQNVLFAVAPVEVFGPRSLTLVLGYVLFFAGVGTLSGAPFAGYLVDSTESYLGAFLFAAAAQLSASVSTFICFVLNRKLEQVHPKNAPSEQHLPGKLTPVPEIV